MKKLDHSAADRADQRDRSSLNFWARLTHFSTNRQDTSLSGHQCQTNQFILPRINTLTHMEFACRTTGRDCLKQAAAKVRSGAAIKTYGKIWLSAIYYNPIYYNPSCSNPNCRTLYPRVLTSAAHKGKGIMPTSQPTLCKGSSIVNDGQFSVCFNGT